MPREVGGLQHPDVVAVDRLGLLLVEARGVRVDVGDVEGPDELVEGEDVAVGSERPPEQGEVVQQPFRDEALLTLQEEVGLGVSLGELLVALLPSTSGMCPKRGTKSVTPASMSAR